MYRERTRSYSNYPQNSKSGLAFQNFDSKDYQKSKHHERSNTQYDENTNYHPGRSRQRSEDEFIVPKSNNNKYYWDRKPTESRAYLQIPSFGNTIRQANDNLPEQIPFPRGSHDLRLNLSREDKERYMGKGWEKPVGHSIRAKQLKNISEQRASNIEKINWKIKGILEKLNDEERNIQDFSRSGIENPHKLAYDPALKSGSHWNASLNNQREHRIKTENAYQPKGHSVNKYPYLEFDIMRKSNYQLRMEQQGTFSDLYERGGFQYERSQYDRSSSKLGISRDQRDLQYKYKNIYPQTPERRNKYSHENVQIESRESPISKYNLIGQSVNSQLYSAESRQRSYDKELSKKLRDSPKWGLNDLNISRKQPNDIDRRFGKIMKQFQSQARSFESSQQKIEFHRQPIQQKLSHSHFDKPYLRRQDSSSVDPHQIQKPKGHSHSLSSVSGKREYSLHRLRNGKSLQEEINKIQTRIDKLQQIKVQLNIGETVCVSQKGRKDLQEIGKDYVKEDYKEVAVPKILLMAKTKAPKRQNQEMKSSYLYAAESKLKKSHENLQYQKQSHTIESNRPSHQPSSERNSLKVFVQMIQKQVALDSNFRNEKTEFDSLHSLQKWQKLDVALEGALSEKEIQQIFSIDEEEVNPFYSTREKPFSYEKLVETYLESSQFWNSHICKNIPINLFQKDGFIERNLDLEKKGRITIEDFVRFINFEGNSFLRTRDIVLIFKRITIGYQISFDDLIGAFTH